jgi:hypothetical protein
MQFAYPNGDFEALGFGLNSFTFTPESAATLGVPQISVSAGPIDVIFHADGTVSGPWGTSSKTSAQSPGPERA